MKARQDMIDAWRQDPQAHVAVIVHVKRNPRQQADAVEALGLSVTFVFGLTRSLAANGSAQSVLALLEQPWVTKVELDQTITTMSEPHRDLSGDDGV